MRYSVFQTPIDLAQKYWKELVSTGDTVIDATCGNGRDTLFLAKLCLSATGGTLIAIDLQQQAIASCKLRLQDAICSSYLSRVQFYHGCHSLFPSEIQPESVKLAVYNLGYLPGGDKTLITQMGTTVKSVQSAIPLIQQGGAISITCYPGHTGGDEEERAVLEFCQQLDASEWSCCFHRWINRNRSPSLLFMQKTQRPTEQAASLPGSK